MIKIENTEVAGWEAAIRGMRNPMNSWDKSDSKFDMDWIDDSVFPHVSGHDDAVIGENDLKLMKQLCKAGTDHRKFMRMITVYADITAPLYWIAEHDTYKVGTVRNSCSFMHKGTSKPFEINDFSVQDERVYYLLNPIKKEIGELTYPYETSEYKVYRMDSGREYKVFKNGKIIACAFSRKDITGRVRHFQEKEVNPSATNSGYFEINLGGRSGERWLLHRLVATLWLDNKENFETVNHINGNKADNSVENLEWCSLRDNIEDGFNQGLYDKNKLHLAYNSWKNAHVVVPPETKLKIKKKHENGMSSKELAAEYNIGEKTINNILYIKPCENEELFMNAHVWETVIKELNALRDAYLETRDINIFKAIRQLLPNGYNVRYTWSANYEVLANMYHSRKNHRLDEWREGFCGWVKTLPYSELITGEENDSSKD